MIVFNIHVLEIYQDVESILWTLLILFDGGEHRQNKAGEHQQESAHTTLHIKQSVPASGSFSWKLISGLSFIEQFIGPADNVPVSSSSLLNVL